jgi:hypothetical protein
MIERAGMKVAESTVRAGRTVAAPSRRRSSGVLRFSLGARPVTLDGVVGGSAGASNEANDERRGTVR